MRSEPMTAEQKKIVIAISIVGMIFWFGGITTFALGFFLGLGASGWPFFAIGAVASLPFSIGSTYLGKRWGVIGNKTTTAAEA